MTAIASLRMNPSPMNGNLSPQPRESGTQPTLSALRTCSWFATWPPGALAALASVSSLRSFAAGQVVAAEGKDLGAVAVVVKGRVRVVRRAEGGREVTLETFRAGDLCADGLFDGANVFPNDWIAGETSLLLFIPRGEFLSQVGQVPEAPLALAKAFEQRLQRSKVMAGGLALADVQARLHRTLARLAREEGEPSSDGTTIRRCPTQQELGNMIGACRETVSRMVAELARQGLLTLQGRKLTITPRFLAQATVSGGA